MQMKKILLFSLVLLFLSALSVCAYETIIIDFPRSSKWNVAFYQKRQLEAILQYIPAGQSVNNWTQSIVVHSYKEDDRATYQLADSITKMLIQQNPTGRYTFLRKSEVDTVAVRSTNNYKNIKGQCEILRVTKAAEGLVSIQYIDRDKNRFKTTYNQWLKIVREARLYNSYWMDNRVINKDESYEL